MKMQRLFLIPAMLFVLCAHAARAGDCESTASTDRFDINNDGTVTEIETGLTWMRCAVGQQWDGATCKGQAQAMSWQEANNYVAELNQIGSTAHKDWRLPNLNELATISELRCGPPRINRVVFPNAGENVFWTKNITPGNSQYAYTLSFGETGVDSSALSAAHYVRLVRGRN
jgi:hypothetical protein